MKKMKKMDRVLVVIPNYFTLKSRAIEEEHGPCFLSRSGFGSDSY